MEPLPALEPMERVILEATFRQLGQMYTRLSARFGGVGGRAESAGNEATARKELELIRQLRETLPESWR